MARQDDTEEALFRAAMQGVEHLSEDSASQRVRRRPGSGKSYLGTARLVIERRGEELSGWAPGENRRLVRRLRRGDPPTDRSLDLHGLKAAEARRALRAVLAEMGAVGEVCLRVIHGRGLRSEAGPVLKQALPDWLAEPPHGQQIRGFVSEEGSRGGALLVLLKYGGGGR